MAAHIAYSFAGTGLAQLLRRLEHFLGRGSDAKIFRQIHPAHNACGVHQELRGTRDVMAILAGAGMQNVVTPNSLCVGIGKKCVRVTGLAAQIRGNRGRINANRNRPNAQTLKSGQLIFDTP
jgi:hypothetical protein